MFTVICQGNCPDIPNHRYGMQIVLHAVGEKIMVLTERLSEQENQRYNFRPFLRTQTKLAPLSQPPELHRTYRYENKQIN